MILPFMLYLSKELLSEKMEKGWCFMAVQFIFGGSGRGKTYFLQHKIMVEV